jgi:hypothetical protein
VLGLERSCRVHVSVTIDFWWQRHLAAMHIFLFQSRRDPAFVAFCRNASGEHLPRRLAPWDMVEGAALPVGGDIAGVGGADLVIAAIEERGF